MWKIDKTSSFDLECDCKRQIWAFSVLWYHFYVVERIFLSAQKRRPEPMSDGGCWSSKDKCKGVYVAQFFFIFPILKLATNKHPTRIENDAIGCNQIVIRLVLPFAFMNNKDVLQEAYILLHSLTHSMPIQLHIL